MSNRDGKHADKSGHRRGQKCPNCRTKDKNSRATLERCDCGCNSKTALVCKTCNWSNF